jgi:hypothetical protein
MPMSSMNVNSGELAFDMSEEVNLQHTTKDVIKLEANASVDKIIQSQETVKMSRYSQNVKDGSLQKLSIPSLGATSDSGEIN